MKQYTASSYGDAFADVYDDWYSEVTDGQATVSCIAKLAPKGAILELGVGTGRIALELLAEGHPVSGVDASQEMLDRLGTKPGSDKINLLCADMSKALPSGTFDLALATYNTFFNLTTEATQLACLTLVHRQLNPEGLLVLETFVPGPSADSEAPRVTPRSMTANAVVLSVTQPGSEPQQLEGQFIHITESGIRLRPWSIRYLTPAQLDELCLRAGFELEQQWSDWHGRPMTPESVQRIAVYRKTAASSS